MVDSSALVLTRSDKFLYYGGAPRLGLLPLLGFAFLTRCHFPALDGVLRQDAPRASGGQSCGSSRGDSCREGTCRVGCRSTTTS